MKGPGTRGARAALGSILFAALLAAGGAFADRGGSDSDTAYGAQQSALAMSSHASSDDLTRTRQEIEAWHYNSDYLFGLSRGTAGSALHPAFKPFVFLVTIPLDIALLPIAAIGGLFG